MIMNYIISALKFLLPIVRRAALDVFVDTVNEAARPSPFRRRRLYTPYTSYNRMSPRTRREAQRNIGRAVREHEELSVREKHINNGGFHDVLMIAFDITGPNSTLVQEWLLQQMPRTGDHFEGDGDFEGDYNIDAFWVADDSSESGCDSAVFVKKGNQKAARETLHSYGLASE